MSSEAGEEYAYEMLGSVMSVLEFNRDKAALALSPEQALANKEAGLFSVFLALENGSPIGSSIDKLYDFYDAGIRYMTLSHSANNLICDSCASDVRKWNGLSPFGREVVMHMNRLGMMIDVSHISDESFYDVLECSRAPVVASHSCCRALAGHPRNMTDDMIRALAAAGGVIQINFFPSFSTAVSEKSLTVPGLGSMGRLSSRSSSPALQTLRDVPHGMGCLTSLRHWSVLHTRRLPTILTMWFRSWELTMSDSGLILTG